MSGSCWRFLGVNEHDFAQTIHSSPSNPGSLREEIFVVDICSFLNHSFTSVATSKNDVPKKWLAHKDSQCEKHAARICTEYSRISFTFSHPCPAAPPKKNNNLVSPLLSYWNHQHPPRKSFMEPKHGVWKITFNFKGVIFCKFSGSMLHHLESRWKATPMYWFLMAPYFHHGSMSSPHRPHGACPLIRFLTSVSARRALPDSSEQWRKRVVLFIHMLV